VKLLVAHRAGEHASLTRDCLWRGR
jgi:hypothetical protein